MSSLKEEINTIMAKYTYHLLKTKNIDVTIPEKILELFKKRIDSRLSLIDETSIRNSEYHYGVYQTLKEIRELLK